MTVEESHTKESRTKESHTNPAGGPLRCIQVLEALAGMAQPASLDAVIERTGLTKLKAYRSLRHLQDAGYVDHIGRDGYRIGCRSLTLGTLVGPRPALLTAARPVLRWLAEVSSESAIFNLRSGSHRVLVMGVEPPSQPVRRGVRLGERAPLTSGASGTAILAHLPPEEAEEIIRSRPRREPRPTPDQLAAIRADGCAFSFSANHVGVSGVSAPLLTPAGGYPLGSMSIGGAQDRLPEATLRRLSGPLRRACKKLAPELAGMLGPHSSKRLSALDVTIQELLDE